MSYWKCLDCLTDGGQCNNCNDCQESILCSYAFLSGFISDLRKNGTKKLSASNLLSISLSLIELKDFDSSIKVLEFVESKFERMTLEDKLMLVFLKTKINKINNNYKGLKKNIEDFEKKFEGYKKESIDSAHHLEDFISVIPADFLRNSEKMEALKNFIKNIDND